MVEFINLSPELLLCVASFLPQIDLLNVSFTCWHLRHVTESELYREYRNPCIYRRSFMPFLKRLIARPELTKHVHRLELKHWNTLDNWNPEYSDGKMEEFQAHLDKMPRPSKSDYDLITQAAKSIGIIGSILPFEPKSSIVEKVRVSLLRGKVTEQVCYEDIYAADVSIEDTPHDQKFCQLLRAGIEAPCAILTLALLPNIREIFLHAAPEDWNILQWRVPHNFDALRRLSARAVEGSSEWPLGGFNNLLQAGKLEILETYGASIRWHHMYIPGRSGDAVPGDRVQFTLQPRTLDIQHLVLQWCTLALSDVKQLVNACRTLRSFYFSSGEGWTPIKPSPEKIIELLRTHKHTLEELYIDIADYERVAHAKEGIRSLADFTCLKVLDTLPHNWANLIESDIQQGPIEEYDRLCHRLPPTIENMIFHQARAAADFSTHHLRDLFDMGESMLPKLQDLTIETMASDHKRAMADVWRAARKMSPVLFNFHPVIVEAREIGTETIFDVTGHARKSLCTKWTGEKYVEQKRFQHPIVQALDRHLRDFPEDGYFSSLDYRMMSFEGLSRDRTNDSEDEDGVAIWGDSDSSSEAEE